MPAPGTTGKFISFGMVHVKSQTPIIVLEPLAVKLLLFAVKSQTPIIVLEPLAVKLLLFAEWKALWRLFQ